MRLVKKVAENKPQALVPLSKLELDQIEGGDYSPIKDRVYKGSYTDASGKTQSSVRDALNVFYHKKCAYCERYCKAEIEHYRPKKAVHEDNTHKGYYWLCYEWSNLVPSCRYCNTEGGKGNRFPTLGQRVFKPDFTGVNLAMENCVASANPLLAEQPLLLHPEIDDPRSYFAFEEDSEGLGIAITGLEDHPRGLETIRICNLNRYEVVLNRNEAVIYPLLKGIDQVFEQLSNGLLPKEHLGQALKIVFTQLSNEVKDEQLTHTLLRWFIVQSEENFESVVLSRIDNSSQKKIVMEAFKAFKQGSL